MERLDDLAGVLADVVADGDTLTVAAGRGAADLDRRGDVLTLTFDGTAFGLHGSAGLLLPSLGFLANGCRIRPVRFRGPLLARHQVDGMYLVRQGHLLEGDRDLAPVRRRRGVELDHD